MGIVATPRIYNSLSVPPESAAASSPESDGSVSEEEGTASDALGGLPLSPEALSAALEELSGGGGGTLSELEALLEGGSSTPPALL